MFHFIHHCAVSFITYYFLSDYGCAADSSLEVKYHRFKNRDGISLHRHRAMSTTEHLYQQSTEAKNMYLIFFRATEQLWFLIVNLQSPLIRKLFFLFYRITTSSIVPSSLSIWMKDFSSGSKINGRCFSELNKLKN